MPALRDRHGRVIGAADGPGQGAVMLRTCPKTARQRMAKGCEPRRRITGDEALIDGDAMEDIDSSQARRILSACGGNLDREDVEALIEMLVQAEKMTGPEATAIKLALDPAPDDSDMATDAAYVARVMANRQAQVAAGQRPASCLRDPIQRPLPRKQAQDAADAFQARYGFDMGGAAYKTLDAPRGAAAAYDAASARVEADTLARFPDMARLR